MVCTSTIQGMFNRSVNVSNNYKKAIFLQNTGILPSTELISLVPNIGILLCRVNNRQYFLCNKAYRLDWGWV